MIGISREDGSQESFETAKIDSPRVCVDHLSFTFTLVLQRPALRTSRGAVAIVAIETFESALRLEPTGLTFFGSLEVWMVSIYPDT